MKYVLMVYFDGAQERIAQLSDTERSDVVQEFLAFYQRPEIRDGNQLQGPATATTVRHRDGRIERTPGSFAGAAAEPLGGYYLIEAADADTAVGLAERIPAVRMGASVEVRPVMEQ